MARDMSIGDPAAPHFVRWAEPVYPPIARKLGKEGEVILRLTLNEAGKLEKLEVVRGDGYGFTEAAVEAMRQSVFSPSREHGRPGKTRILVPVRFVLRENRP